MNSELIQHLETAAASTRELDWRIAQAIGHPSMDRARPDFFPGFMERSQMDKAVPPYTSSLDAALTLLPEGKAWGIGTIMYDELPPRRMFAANCRREGYIGPETPEIDAVAHTAALALCSACLKVRASNTVSTTE